MNRKVINVFLLYLFFYSENYLASIEEKNNNEIDLVLSSEDVGDNKNNEKNNELEDSSDSILLNKTELKMYINIYSLYAYLISIILDDISISHPLVDKENASKLFILFKENFDIVQSLMHFSKEEVSDRVERKKIEKEFYFIMKALSLYSYAMGYKDHVGSEVDFSESSILKLLNKILYELQGYSYIIKVNEVVHFDELKELVGKTGSTVTMLLTLLTDIVNYLKSGHGYFKIGFLQERFFDINKIILDNPDHFQRKYHSILVDLSMEKISKLQELVQLMTEMQKEDAISKKNFLYICEHIIYNTIFEVSSFIDFLVSTELQFWGRAHEVLDVASVKKKIMKKVDSSNKEMQKKYNKKYFTKKIGEEDFYSQIDAFILAANDLSDVVIELNRREEFCRLYLPQKLYRGLYEVCDSFNKNGYFAQGLSFFKNNLTSMFSIFVGYDAFRYVQYRDSYLFKKILPVFKNIYDAFNNVAGGGRGEFWMSATHSDSLLMLRQAVNFCIGGSVGGGSYGFENGTSLDDFVRENMDKNAEGCNYSEILNNTNHPQFASSLLQVVNCWESLNVENKSSHAFPMSEIKKCLQIIDETSHIYFQVYKKCYMRGNKDESEEKIRSDYKSASNYHLLCTRVLEASSQMQSKNDISNYILKDSRNRDYFKSDELGSCIGEEEILEIVSALKKKDKAIGKCRCKTDPYFDAYFTNANHAGVVDKLNKIPGAGLAAFCVTSWYAQKAFNTISQSSFVSSISNFFSRMHSILLGERVSHKNGRGGDDLQQSNSSETRIVSPVLSEELEHISLYGENWAHWSVESLSWFRNMLTLLEHQLEGKPVPNALKNLSKSVYLIGQSGAGKSYLIDCWAKQIASLQTQYKVNFNVNVVNIDPKHFDKDFHDSTAGKGFIDLFEEISNIIEEARRNSEVYIIVIDEAHLLFVNKNTQTIDTARLAAGLKFFSELNNKQKYRSRIGGVYVVLATNRPSLIPHEFLANGGRIGEVVYIPELRSMDCINILKNILKKNAYSIDNIDFDYFEALFANYELNYGKIEKIVSNAIYLSNILHVGIDTSILQSAFDSTIRNIVRYKNREVYSSELKHELALSFAADTALTYFFNNENTRSFFDCVTIAHIVHHPHPEDLSKLYLPSREKIYSYGGNFTINKFDENVMSVDTVVHKILSSIGGMLYLKKNAQMMMNKQNGLADLFSYLFSYFANHVGNFSAAKKLQLEEAAQYRNSLITIGKYHEIYGDENEIYKKIQLMIKEIEIVVLQYFDNSLVKQFIEYISIELESKYTLHKEDILKNASSEIKVVIKDIEPIYENMIHEVKNIIAKYSA